MSLVGGLVILTAASFSIDNDTLRSTLLGGLVANAGAAVAFHFASKDADQARKDILNASGAQESVPDLDAKSPNEAKSTIAASPFVLLADPATPEGTTTVSEQVPAAGTRALRGTTITANFALTVNAMATARCRMGV